ncbi:unnamed protein product [marine sediment metagenome]|uniref:Uncharacterized protein n=1 Tax=marine sediment metagenome TaxID=412755 RepID=X1T1X9_9ZZZZ
MSESWIPVRLKTLWIERINVTGGGGSRSLVVNLVGLEDTFLSFAK